jgi:hypothetical protein
MRTTPTSRSRFDNGWCFKSQYADNINKYKVVHSNVISNDSDWFVEFYSIPVELSNRLNELKHVYTKVSPNGDLYRGKDIQRSKLVNNGDIIKGIIVKQHRGSNVNKPVLLWCFDDEIFIPPEVGDHSVYQWKSSFLDNQIKFDTQDQAPSERTVLLPNQHHPNIKKSPSLKKRSCRRTDGLKDRWTTTNVKVTCEPGHIREPTCSLFNVKSPPFVPNKKSSQFESYFPIWSKELFGTSPNPDYLPSTNQMSAEFDADRWSTQTDGLYGLPDVILSSALSCLN